MEILFITVSDGWKQDLERKRERERQTQERSERSERRRGWAQGRGKEGNLGESEEAVFMLCA